MQTLDNRVTEKLLEPSTHVQNATQATVKEFIAHDFSSYTLQTSQNPIEESIPGIEVI